MSGRGFGGFGAPDRMPGQWPSFTHSFAQPAADGNDDTAPGSTSGRDDSSEVRQPRPDQHPPRSGGRLLLSASYQPQRIIGHSSFDGPASTSNFLSGGYQPQGSIRRGQRELPQPTSPFRNQSDESSISWTLPEARSGGISTRRRFQGSFEEEDVELPRQPVRSHRGWRDLRAHHAFQQRARVDADLAGVDGRSRSRQHRARHPTQIPIPPSHTLQPIAEGHETPSSIPRTIVPGRRGLRTDAPRGNPRCQQQPNAPIDLASLSNGQPGSNTRRRRRESFPSLPKNESLRGSFSELTVDTDERAAKRQELDPTTSGSSTLDAPVLGPVVQGVLFDIEPSTFQAAANQDAIQSIARTKTNKHSPRTVRRIQPTHQGQADNGYGEGSRFIPNAPLLPRAHQRTEEFVRLEEARERARPVVRPRNDPPGLSVQPPGAAFANVFELARNNATVHPGVRPPVPREEPPHLVVPGGIRPTIPTLVQDGSFGPVDLEPSRIVEIYRQEGTSIPPEARRFATPPLLPHTLEGFGYLRRGLDLYPRGGITMMLLEQIQRRNTERAARRNSQASSRRRSEVARHIARPSHRNTDRHRVSSETAAALLVILGRSEKEGRRQELLDTLDESAGERRRQSHGQHPIGV